MKDPYADVVPGPLEESDAVWRGEAAPKKSLLLSEDPRLIL